jgi:hypothetical protein
MQRSDSVNTKEAVKVIIDTYKKIESTDEEIIKIANNLKIVLLNLQIENARIKEHTGIEPIIIELERNINKIKEDVKGVISENREELNLACNILMKEVVS